MNGQQEFQRLLQRHRGAGWVPTSVLLAVDPGETIGWALFLHAHLVDCGQLATESTKKAMDTLFHKTPTAVVCEDYRVYGHKLKEHSWNKLRTPKLIGAIQLLCEELEVPLTLQLASQAKGFCTQQKLRQWGFYQVGLRHANDAIRHGAYFLLFNKRAGVL